MVPPKPLLLVLLKLQKILSQLLLQVLLKQGATDLHLAFFVDDGDCDDDVVVVVV